MTQACKTMAAHTHIHTHTKISTKAKKKKKTFNQTTSNLYIWYLHMTACLRWVVWASWAGWALRWLFRCGWTLSYRGHKSGACRVSHSKWQRYSLAQMALMVCSQCQLQFTSFLSFKPKMLSWDPLRVKRSLLHIRSTKTPILQFRCDNNSWVKIHTNTAH